MFEIGDYVLNATNGICKISEIVELDMSGDKQLKSYFLLRPVEEENDRVYIPVDNADKRIRKVITQDEAQAVLDRVPEIEALAVNNENEQRAQAGKKSTAVDERYGKMAEHNLNAELAFVLEKDKQEIKDIIHDML